MISLVNADTRRIPLADKSIHMVATSPPYWALRDYDVAGQLGMEPLHDCAAWARGERPCDDCYVCALRVVAAEIHRVLRDDGVFFLNLGDGYAQKEIRHRDGTYPTRLRPNQAEHVNQTGRKMELGNLKPKDLVGIPWRVALALQADGWYLRSDIVWAKGISFCDSYSGSSMPESVKDRPSKSHEYVFLLAKRPRYFFDMEAVREDASMDSGWARQRANGINTWSYNDTPERIAATGQTIESSTPGTTTRNPRSVWAINPENYAGAHFATWPTALVEKMILAGTSERGCCPTCSTPWVRITRKEFVPQPDIRDPEKLKRNGAAMDPSSRWGGFERGSIRTETLNWRPSCKCNAGQPVPCIVLDPFCGSGTTGVVARRHGRNFIGLDLSFAYLRDQAKTRLGLTALEAFENGAAVHDPNDYSDLFKVTP